ncbi:MAG: hypothetical protein AMXMBFR33_71170 [Candidatus Xenobia bacterium]
MDDPLLDALFKRLERGERPGAVVRHAGPALRHEIALRWFTHRNEHLGSLVRDLSFTALAPDAARVASELKSGQCRLASGDAALVLRALSDPDAEVRRAAEGFLFSGLDADWADALGTAALSEWSAEARLQVARAGFGPADPELREVFGWVAGGGEPPDAEAVARVTPRLTETQRSVLAARLRQSGRGHMWSRPDVRTSLERLLEGRDGDALWAELTLGGSTDPLQDEELRQLLVPHPTPLELLGSFQADLVAGEDLLVVPGQAIVALDDLRSLLEFEKGSPLWSASPGSGGHPSGLPYAPPRVLVAGPRRLLLQPRWISLADTPHLTQEHLEPCRVVDLDDGPSPTIPLEEPLVGAVFSNRLFVLQDPMVQCWSLTSGRTLWSHRARWARSLLVGEGLVVLLGKEHLEVWEADSGELLSSLDVAGRAALQGDVLVVETSPGLRLFGLPQLHERACLTLPGCIAWSWRADGSLLTATSTAIQHWSPLGQVEASWRQQRQGKLLAFHPTSRALAASDGRRLEFFHPGSEFPDQVLEAPGRPQFTSDGSRLLIGSQVFAVRLELALSRACPADLMRATASPNRSSKLVEALLRFRLRHEVMLGDPELSDDAIELE